MADVIVFALALLGVSIYSWYMVFNESARRKSERKHWLYPRMNKEQKEINEGMSLAVFVLAGVISSVFLLFLIILGLFHLFRHA